MSLNVPARVGRIAIAGHTAAEIEVFTASDDAELVIIRQAAGAVLQRKDVLDALSRCQIAKRGTPILFLRGDQTIELITERQLVEAGWCRKETADLLGGATAEDAYRKGYAAGFRAARAQHGHVQQLALGAGDPVLEPDETPLLALGAGDGETIMDAYVEIED